MPRKVRLDQHLLTKGFVSSRQQAQRLILAGKVRDLTGRLLDKPGMEVLEEIDLQVKELPRFVSRGGEKLLQALKSFTVNIDGRVCLDAGISTGGFTDCLLQHGALKVYGIDVGYGQTAWKLRKNPSVVLKERTNIRNLEYDDLYGFKDPVASLAVADLSFISLRKVMPAIKALLHPIDGEALFLVKPQFEVGPERVGKGGVVRDEGAHIDALQGVIDAAIYHGWRTKGLVPSPITGPAGNHEYLLWLALDGDSEKLSGLKELVANTLR